MEPIDQPIETLAPALRTGSLSPVALTEAALEQIRLRDGLLESFVAVSDGAIGAAREVDSRLDVRCLSDFAFKARFQRSCGKSDSRLGSYYF